MSDEENMSQRCQTRSDTESVPDDFSESGFEGGNVLVCVGVVVARCVARLEELVRIGEEGHLLQIENPTDEGYVIANDCVYCCGFLDIDVQSVLLECVAANLEKSADVVR